jgi:hypothetical protein
LTTAHLVKIGKGGNSDWVEETGVEEGEKERIFLKT